MLFSSRHLLIVLGLVGIAVTGQPAQAEPTPEYTLQALVRRAKATNPAMDVARAMLADYRALFDRAYYGWTPTLKLEGVLAPLPERQLLAGHPPHA